MQKVELFNGYTMDRGPPSKVDLKKKQCSLFPEKSAHLLIL